MCQKSAIILLLFFFFATVAPACTPTAPPHETKDRYSTGIVDDGEGEQEQQRVPLGLPDAYTETKEPEKEDAEAADSTAADTDCTPFHPDYPNC